MIGHYDAVTLPRLSVVQVIDTLPSMMNALRMVWIISRHYNRDDRMVPLLERVAWELAERVYRVITFRTLFEYHLLLLLHHHHYHRGRVAGVTKYFDPEIN